jgi:glycosyltransferase involved in cell wall biosynthesis
MKVLWHSNAPWVPTGYGVQTKLFVPRIADAGHDVAVSAMYGLGGDSTEWGGITVYPQGFDGYGNDVLPAYALHHLKDPNHGWVLVLFDAWPINNRQLSQFHVACWAPVDHDPVPPGVLRFFVDIKALPIAMSRFGQQQFERVGLEALYVPHGFDPVMQPKDKAEARAAIGLPEDAFVVGMNAANKGKSVHRKNFDGAFQAFKRFAESRSDAILYVHSESAGAIGHDLENLVAFLGIGDRVVFADQFVYRMGVPAEAMPHLYSAFDVFLNPALGEGFGVPIIEAQACGVPAIVTDFTAMTEVCGVGWAVDGDLFWNEAQESMWKRPHVGGLVDALEEAYGAVGPSLSADAVEFAARYHADRVWEDHWLPVLANLEERIYPAPVEVAA